MKFTKFGKALLMSALSVGVILGVTSCVQSYSVGYLYVTGTVTAQSTGNGIISGFKIDHNTGKLIPINGLPVSSGGANPGPRRPAHRQPVSLCAEPGRQCRRRLDLHHGRPLPELQHYPVRGRRQRHSYAAGDVLYAGDQSVPHRCRQLGQLSFTCWITIPPLPTAHPRALRIPIRAAHSRWARSHDLRRHYGVQDRPDHRPPDLGGQLPGHFGQRSALPYFPVPANPIDFRSWHRATSSP